ncbi:MAG: hypothetical protein AAF202_02965, partial [Pseudomonadota bacterium]
EGEVKNLAADYFRGFMVIQANRKYKAMPEESMAQLERLYSKQYGQYVLGRVLSGKQGKELLKKKLGPNSLLTRTSFL